MSGIRTVMLAAWALAIGAFVCPTQVRAGAPRDESPGAPELIKDNQRVVIVMVDGLGLDYLDQSSMPVLKGMMAKGFSKPVRGVMPSVTSCNNASICCGTWPAEHGITGNSYFDEAKGQAEYMEDGDSLLNPTLFQRAARRGIKSTLLTARKKTVRLLSRGAEIAAAEEPSPEFVRSNGPPPPIYSREINFWLWQVAIELFKDRPDIRCLYVHTTDDPMHMWPHSAPESQEHLSRLALPRAGLNRGSCHRGHRGHREIGAGFDRPHSSSVNSVTFVAKPCPVSRSIADSVKPDSGAFCQESVA